MAQGMNQLRAAAGMAQPPQQEAEDPARALIGMLEKRKEEIKSLLPKSMPVDKFLSIVKVAIAGNPDLVMADRRSFFLACLQAARRGLYPDGREALLNVYNTKVKQGGREEWIKKVQFEPMWLGMVKKLYASGHVTYVDGAAVYEKDEFTFERGESPKLVHKPWLKADPGEIVAAYVVVKLNNGEVKREVMPRWEIDKVRGMSKSGDSGASPWSKWFDQQAIKTVGKRMVKQLPTMDEFEALVTDDNEASTGAVADSTYDSMLGQAAPALENSPSQTANFTAPPAPEAEFVNAGAPQQTQAQPSRPAVEPAAAPAPQQQTIDAADVPEAGGEDPRMPAIQKALADWLTLIDSTESPEDLAATRERVNDWIDDLPIKGKPLRELAAKVDKALAVKSSKLENRKG